MNTEGTQQITVVVPAFNEALVIADFVAKTFASLPEGSEVLVVDDGSTDGTPRLLTELAGEFEGLRVMTHDRNRGIGAALATGFRGASGDVIVTMDADLSHPAALVQDLVETCRVADAAYASRYVPGGSMESVPLWRVLISRGANIAMRLAFRTSVRDLTTGMRAFRGDVVRNLRLDATGFEAQLEITVRLLAAGCRIDEVPMVLRNRSVGESKMRYLRLAPRYAATFVRMMGVRWGHRRGAGR
jgi:dolichol-phosphate mannosyltransferase